ncbi:MAG: hypothetical protein M3Y53_01785 [Thermoproteota archaeon]|nr:hypothetical protein [Thermoproteota archaeon]
MTSGKRSKSQRLDTKINREDNENKWITTWNNYLTRLIVRVCMLPKSFIIGVLSCRRKQILFEDIQFPARWIDLVYG